MVDPAVLEIPMRLESWEPDYQVATFRSDRLDFPSPPLPEMERFESGDAPRVADVAVAEAMLGTGPSLERRVERSRRDRRRRRWCHGCNRCARGSAGPDRPARPIRRSAMDGLGGGRWRSAWPEEGDRRRQVRGLVDGGGIGRRRMAAGTRPNGGSDRAVGVVPVGRSGARIPVGRSGSRSPTLLVAGPGRSPPWTPNEPRGPALGPGGGGREQRSPHCIWVEASRIIGSTRRRCAVRRGGELPAGSRPMHRGRSCRRGGRGQPMASPHPPLSRPCCSRASPTDLWFDPGPLDVADLVPQPEPADIVDRDDQHLAARLPW